MDNVSKERGKHFHQTSTQWVITIILQKNSTCIAPEKKATSDVLKRREKVQTEWSYKNYMNK